MMYIVCQKDCLTCEIFFTDGI